MDKELERYYTDRFEMFTSDGWKSLIEDLEQMKAATDHIGGVNNMESLFLKKGELSIISWVLGLQAMSENAYEELLIESNI